MTKPLTIKARDVHSFATSDARLLDLGWELALIGGHHRDSGALDVSNTLELEARLEAVDPDQEHWGGMLANHWAVGWYHHIVVDPTFEPVMSVLKQAQMELEDYPILNEDLMSSVECDLHEDGRCDEHCPFDHRCEDCNRIKCICDEENLKED